MSKTVNEQIADLEQKIAANIEVVELQKAQLAELQSKLPVDYNGRMIEVGDKLVVVVEKLKDEGYSRQFTLGKVYTCTGYSNNGSEVRLTPFVDMHDSSWFGKRFVCIKKGDFNRG